MNGIRFFYNKNYPGFNNCELTINYTSFMKNLFDAFNRQFPTEGKKNSQHTEV